ncbi:MAG: DUF2812 domain-containing protein [Oscillospiraceae bacterium]|nr:DUF2812 domain-containing protein [Oscillospiraceae bacterium]
MTKCCPMWIADPVGSEKQLDVLAEKGWRLTSMNFFGVCTFEESSPRHVHHRIVLEKGGVTKGASEKGWECLYQGKVFYVAATEKDLEPISYAAHKKIHSIIKMIFFLLLMAFFGYFLGMWMASIDYAKSLAELFSIGEAVVLTAMLAVIATWVHFAVGGKKMPKSDIELGGYMKTIPKENFAYDKKTERRMIKEGRMKAVLKLGWFYAPDKAEEWVEKMALDGWVFYRFDPMGSTFYFLKEDGPAKLRFAVDYQNHSSDEYYEMTKEEGWKLEFTSVTRTMGFSIWSKRWDDEDTRPEFYSDIESEYARAKRFAITFGISIGAMIPVVISIVALYLTEIGTDDTLPAMLTFLVVYALLMVEYLVFFARIMGYYLRVRKRMKK